MHAVYLLWIEFCSYNRHFADSDWDVYGVLSAAAQHASAQSALITQNCLHWPCSLLSQESQHPLLSSASSPACLPAVPSNPLPFTMWIPDQPADPSIPTKAAKNSDFCQVTELNEFETGTKQTGQTLYVVKAGTCNQTGVFLPHLGARILIQLHSLSCEHSQSPVSQVSWKERSGFTEYSELEGTHKDLTNSILQLAIHPPSFSSKEDLLSLLLNPPKMAQVSICVKAFPKKSTGDNLNQ